MFGFWIGGGHRGNMSADAELLRRYAALRDEAAFAELVRRHVDGVYSSALRRVGRDVHLAEDVVQRVFVALARKAGSLVHHPVLAGWLHLTTRNEAANVVRTEQRRKQREGIAMAMHENPATAGDAPDWSRVAPVLDEVIDELPERDRTAVLLRFVERRPFAEIGTALGLSGDAARMRVERALDKLHGLLSRRGIKSTAAALGLALANHAVVAAPSGLAAAATGAALGSTTATVGLLSFMGVSKLTGVIVGSAVLVTALGVAWHEQHVAGKAAAEFALAQAEERALRSRWQEIEGRLAARSEAASALATAEAAKDRAAPTVPGQSAEWNGVAEGDAFLGRHPEVRQALVDAQDAKGRALYRAFFAAAHLTPSEIEQLLVIQRSGSASGFPFGPAGQYLMLRTGPDVSFEERRNQLRELLGEERAKQFQGHIARENAIGHTAAFAAAMAFTDTPLAADQTSTLAEVLAAARVKGPGIRTMEYNWEAALAKAKDFLSEPQLAGLARLAARETARTEENRARAAAHASGTAAPLKP